MTVVIRNPLYRLIALGVSVAIVLILYFAVIKPNHDNANQAVSTTEQQVQQAVNKASKQGGVPAGVKSLTDCIAAAGTDTSKLQACQAQFK